MNIYIVTGTSRGIGESLARQLLKEDHLVFCISRTTNQSLIKLAQDNNHSLTYFPFDLNHIAGIDGLFDEIFDIVKRESSIHSLTLINNAGMLAPVAPIEQNSTGSIVENVTINLLAPMVTTSHFIRHTQDWAVDKRIMNISSASAKYLLPSQSCYSSSKAGLDSFSKSIHLEQSVKDYPVKIASVYPGMIDTQLQADIRSADKKNFPYVDQFIQLAQEGKLQTPEETAERLLRLLNSESYGAIPLIEEI